MPGLIREDISDDTGVVGRRECSGCRGILMRYCGWNNRVPETSQERKAYERNRRCVKSQSSGGILWDIIRCGYCRYSMGNDFWDAVGS